MKRLILISILLILGADALAQSHTLAPRRRVAAAASTIIARTSQDAAATGGGNQSITVSGFGTPKCALFTVGSATADATPADDAVLSIGATDLTDEAVASTFIEHNQAAADSYNRGATDEVILIMDGTGAIDGEATINGTVTDGVEITWGNAPAAAYTINTALFGGSDLSCDVGTFTASSSSGGTVDVATGFEPDVLIIFRHHGNGGDSGFGDVARSHGGLSVGFSDNDGASPFPQYAWVFTDRDGQDPTQISGRAFDDRAGGNIRTNSTTLRNTIQITDYYAGPTPAAGFEVTTQDLGNADSPVYGYLALNFGGSASHKVGDEVGSASTESVSYTDAGFKSQFVMMLQTNATTYTGSTAQTYAGLGFAMWDATNQGACTLSNQDGAGTTVSKGAVADDAFYNLKSSGIAEYQATFTSFDATGWTLNWTDASFGATLNPYLAIEE